MKTRLCLVLGITAIFALSSCNEDRIISSIQLVKSISVTGRDFQIGESSTRATYTDDINYHFYWTEGDTIGIYPVGGDQIAFPISSGEGNRTALFDGGAWSLRTSFSYSAYYPFSASNYDVNETSIPVKYTGQTQNGNGSLDFLDRYDYQASVATRPDAEGNINIEMNHLGCFVSFNLTLPIADTIKSITLVNSKTPFILSGKYDLTKGSISITPDVTSSTIIIPLSNTVTTEDKVLTVYVMMAPQDLSASEIEILIEGTTYKSYLTTVSGKKMLAGKAYSYKASVLSGINFNGSVVVWDGDGLEKTIELDKTEVYILAGDTTSIYAIHKNSGVVVDGDVQWSSSDESIATVSNEGIITAKCKGTCFVTATIGSIQSSCVVVVVGADGKENGRDYVDLGLSVKWATFNVGANAPATIGSLFAWGELDGKLYSEKISYSNWSNYKWCNGSSNSITKYNIASDDYRTAYYNTILEPEDDVAHIRWGGNWRMPTKEELEELLNNCTWYWIYGNSDDIYSTRGYIVTSKKPGYTDRSIFIPFTNQYFSSYYWSSTLSTSRATHAFSLFFQDERDFPPTVWAYFDRTAVMAVRPVISSETYYTVTSIEMGESYYPESVECGESKQIKAIPKNVAGTPIAADVQWSSSDESIAKVSEEGIITGIGAGTCIITAYVGSVQSDCRINVFSIESTGSYKGFEYVDLGLSVNWATCNVGARKPEGYGDYFAFGEIEPYYDPGYAQESPGTHWKPGMSDGYSDTNYKNQGDDVARAKWGGNWRLPTKEEQQELISDCVWTSAKINGVSGYVITSKKSGFEGRSIFMPSAGYRAWTNLYGGFYYRSSSKYYSNKYYYLTNIYMDYNLSYGESSFAGLPVRPVCP